MSAGFKTLTQSKKKPEDFRDLEFEIWLAAGGFHFDNGTTGFQNITGPRVRLEIRAFDIPLLGDDSRVVLGTQYELDDVRGDVGTLTFGARIPFGPGGGRNRDVRLTGLARRMVAPIVRDPEIVTNSGFGIAESAKFANSGQVISTAIVVDGNTINPEATIEGAGANSIVIADGFAGTIDPADTVDLNPNQHVLGGGTQLAVIGCDTGAAATFDVPGTRPTINNSFVLNDGGTLSGLNIAGQGTTAAVQIVGNGIFQLFDNSLTNLDLGNTNTALLPDGNSVNIADLGIFTSSFSGNLSIFETTVITPGPSAFLITDMIASADITDSDFFATGNGEYSVQLETHGFGQLIANFSGGSIIGLDGEGVRDIESHDDSVLTVSFRHSELVGGGSGEAIDDVISADRSLLTLNVIDSSITSLDEDGIERLESRNDSTLIANFMRSSIIANGSHEGIDTIRSRDNSVLTTNFFDSSIASAENEAIEEIDARDDSMLTANFTRTQLFGGQDGIFSRVPTVGSGNNEGIEDFNSCDNATLIANFVDSSIISNSNNAIDDIEANDDSTMIVNFTRTTLIGGQNGSDEAIDLIYAERDSTLTLNFTDASIISSDDGAIRTIAIEDDAVANINFTRTSVIGGQNGSGAGIETIVSVDDSVLTLNFDDSSITGTAAAALGSLGSNDDSIMNVNFGRTTISGGDSTGAIGAFMDIVSEEDSQLNLNLIDTNVIAAGVRSFERINSTEDSILTAVFTGSTFTSGLDSVVFESSDSSMLNANLMNNTLTSGTGFFDLNLNQTGGSTFNVVDLLNLSGNNNGASVTTSGTITDTP